MKRLMIVGLAVCAAAAAFAAIEITAPAAGSTVSQLHPTQAKFVHESQIEREKYFDGGKNAAALRKDGSQPKPVEIAWTGAKGACEVTVRRLPDGKVFFSGKVKDGSVKVDSLEIAREWEVTVSDGRDVAKNTFRTEDQAPRLIYVNKRIANARDVGGRIGLDGRRIRQGLVFRTVGLNSNAPTDYYSNDEIMELYRAGKLDGMGSQGKHIAHKLKEGGKLHSTPKKNRLIKREKYAPGERRMTEEERVAILARWGFRSDIDLRSDRECFGMTGSPLGPDVTLTEGGQAPFAGGMTRGDRLWYSMHMRRRGSRRGSAAGQLNSRVARSRRFLSAPFCRRTADGRLCSRMALQGTSRCPGGRGIASGRLSCLRTGRSWSFVYRRSGLSGFDWDSTGENVRFHLFRTSQNVKRMV